MKKTLVLFSSLAIIALALTSCKTLHYESQDSGETLNVTQLAVKDYDIIGPCTVTATATEKATIFSSSKVGSEVVYPMLLEKAVEMGGQDVINVRVAKKEDADIKLYGIFYKEITYTYTATALAIKYNNHNLETKAIYDKDGKVTAITSPVIESKSSGIKRNTVSIKNLFNIFKRK